MKSDKATTTIIRKSQKRKFGTTKSKSAITRVDNKEDIVDRAVRERLTQNEVDKIVADARAREAADREADVRRKRGEDILNSWTAGA